MRLRSWEMCWSSVRLLGEMIYAPTGIEQLVAVQNLARMLGEERQQLYVS